ncbi:hypothetical protein ADK67_28395 [Saccharothrix sp. NRRL B-16348]|uniref:hypothetical protein n=1 Tax=Saccharothrix sp. NRRL B-16348 TaxID=1415542 RepID=UPI0006AF96E8|nr:hypothetical protein [Saccharothrix sp. NRRL B-16348]KOX20965.1 hypothetical protein ADK67_28395 [Saccharothrix sp. NRRL B-16348]
MTTIKHPEFVAAPLLVLTYGVCRIVDGFDGERGPGPAWTIGHLAFLAALALFVVIFRHMRRLIGPRARITAVVATLGALALFGQFSVDVVAGFVADDHEAMAMWTRGIRTLPGVATVIYDFGPYLFYVGQLVLVVQLALHRHVKAWTPVLVLADLSMPFIDKDLIPVGAVLMVVSFLPLALRAREVGPARETALV